MRSGQPPQLHALREGAGDRKITWLELFYDLIFVATIIQLGNTLSDDVSPAGALVFILLFVPVWWSWTGMMFYFNRFVADDLWHRVLVFVQMFAIATMAISVTGAFGDTSRDFALAYFAARVVLVAFYLRTWRHVTAARPLIRRYAIGFSAAASLWLVSAVVPEPFRYALWVLGLLLEFYVALSPGSRRLVAVLPPDSPHMTERYGLLTIIVLGESFIKVVSGLAGHGLSLASLTYSALGFVVAASLWWLYFDNIAEAVVRRLPAAPYLWVYTHLPLTIGITAVGVGVNKVTLQEFGGALPDQYRWLISSAVLACLVAIAALELVTDSKKRGRASVRSRAVARLSAAAVVLLAALVGGLLPVVVTVLVIALACVSQVLFDLVSGATTEDMGSVELDQEGGA